MITRIVPSYETYEFDAKKNLYCICVFVINEGEKLLNQLKTMSGICTGLVDVVVADGGSTDGSTDHDTLKALGVNTLLVKTGEGKLGSQMRMAFDWALNRGYEGVVVVDGNGKDGMDAIPRFVKELKNGVDHVQGSRFIKGGHHENTPKSRLWGLKLLHVPLMRLASGFKYTDTTNGFRAYSARLLSSDKLSIFRSCFAGYELHYYLAIEAARQKFKCSEIPVSRVYPATGKVPTKISGVRGNLIVVLKLLASCLHLYSTKKQLLSYIRAFVILLVSIYCGYLIYESHYYNKYSIVDNTTIERWQQDSEGIVVRDKINPETRYDQKWYSLYPMGGHYIGGQGIADSYICHLFESASLDKKIEILKKTEVLLCAIALAYLCFWIGTEFSLIASILFGICAINCQFMIISAKNLYWSMWTMYLPLAIFLFILRRDENNYLKRSCIIPVYLIAVISTMFARFVTMFEFSSSMMVLTELPLLYYALKNRWSSKKFFLNALWTGISAFTVFIFSYLILYLQILAYRANWSFSKAWDLATANVRYRTGVGGEDHVDSFILSFIPNIESLFKKYLDCTSSFGKYGEYSVSTIISWSFVFFLIGVLTTLLAKKMKSTRKYIAFGSFVFLSTLLQFIWIITAKGHACVHTHINFILWNIPLLLMAALIGYTISILLLLVYHNIKLLKRNIYTWILTCAILFVLCVLFFIYYKSNYSAFEILSRKFEKDGVSVSNSDVQYVVLPQQRRIFFKLPDDQIDSSRFVYHIYPYSEKDLKEDRKQYKFNISDFSIKDKFDRSFVLKSPYSSSKYEFYQCQLPSYMYTKIVIEQYDSNNKLLWKMILDNEKMEKRSYKIYNLSDRNWTCGILNSNKKCLLFMNTQFIVPGDYVIFPDNTVNRVERILDNGQTLSVFLENEAHPFDPDQPCVFSKNNPETLLKQEAEAINFIDNSGRDADDISEIPNHLSLQPIAIPVND